MNSLNGKTILITGASDFIGRHVALEFGKLGAIVLLHAHSLPLGLSLLNDLTSQLPAASFDLFIANPEFQSEIRQMAVDIKKAYSRLDVLINNSNELFDKRKLTWDTVEATFAVNHLAPFLLTHLILPLLKNSANAQVINVSSHAHYMSGFNTKNMQGEQYYNGKQLYCFTKLCNLLFTYYLADKLQKTPISVNAVCGGTAEM